MRSRVSSICGVLKLAAVVPGRCDPDGVRLALDPRGTLVSRAPLKPQDHGSPLRIGETCGVKTPSRPHDRVDTSETVTCACTATSPHRHRPSPQGNPRHLTPQANLGVSWGVSVPGPTAFGGRLRADGYSRVTRRDPTVPFNRPRHSGALSETRKQLCVVAPLSSAESRPCARGAFASVLRAARRMPRIALSRRHRRS
jgi:hypothetical protein